MHSLLLKHPPFSRHRDCLTLSLAEYEDWSLDQSIEFLKEQGVAIANNPTLQDVQKLVAERADTAATVSPPHDPIFLYMPCASRC